MSEIQNRKDIKSRNALYVRLEKEDLDKLKKTLAAKGIKLDAFITHICKNSETLLNKFLKQQAG